MQMSSGVHMNEDYDIHSEEPNLFAEGIYQSWFTEALRFSDFAATLDRAAPPGTVPGRGPHQNRGLPRVTQLQLPAPTLVCLHY